MGWFTNEEINAVAKDLGVKPEEVWQMEQRLHANDIAFDLPTDHDENTLLAPSEYLISAERDPLLQLEGENWEDYTQGKLQAVVAALDDRSKDILDQRYIADQKATLAELASKYNISMERVRQLEQSALTKIKQAIAGDQAANN